MRSSSVIGLPSCACGTPAAAISSAAASSSAFMSRTGQKACSLKRKRACFAPAAFRLIGGVMDALPIARVSEAEGVAFVTTQWSMVLTAQGASPAADAALETLCRRYWRPLFGLVRRSGFVREEAEDLTQAFFARLLERRDLDAVRKEKGRLRSYLLVALKHFLANERHRASAIKRGEGKRVLSLDEMREDERAS